MTTATEELASPAAERIDGAGIPDPASLLAPCRKCGSAIGEQCRWSDPNDLPRRQMHRARRDDIAALRAAGLNRTPPIELIPPVNGQLELALAAIDPGSTNPRTAPGDLSGLAASILTHGILQPLVVRPKPDGSGYALVAGSRRLGAATEAGLESVPVVVRPATDDRDAILLALAENSDREPLGPIDEAIAFRRLMALGMSQVEIGAARGGKAQETVSNSVRLLLLPADVQDRIAAGELSAAHGVALCRKDLDGFPAVQSELARLAVEQGTPAKALARGLPFASELIGLGLVRSLAYPKFDRAQCEACPHNAFLKGAAGLPGSCLMPEEFDRKQAAAELANTAALELAREQAKAARRAPVGAVGPTAEGEGQGPTGLPNLTDLPAGSIAEIWGARPSGCSEACPCNLEVVGRDQKLTVVCTDPERYRRLSDEQRAAEQAERQTEVDSDLGALVQILQSGDEAEARVMALAVLPALRNLPPEVIAGAAERLDIGHLFDAKAVAIRDFADPSAALAELCTNLLPCQIAALGVLGPMQSEAAAYVSYKRPRPLWGWWSGDGDGGQVSGALEQSAPPEPEADRLLCHECGIELPPDALPDDDMYPYEYDAAGNQRDQLGCVGRGEDAALFCADCARRVGVFGEAGASE